MEELVKKAKILYNLKVYYKKIGSTKKKVLLEKNTNIIYLTQKGTSLLGFRRKKCLITEEEKLENQI